MYFFHYATRRTEINFRYFGRFFHSFEKVLTNCKLTLFLNFNLGGYQNVPAYSRIVHLKFSKMPVVDKPNHRIYPFKSIVSHAIPLEDGLIPFGSAGFGSRMCLSRPMRHRWIRRGGFRCRRRFAMPLVGASASFSGRPPTARPVWRAEVRP